jgi:voltage-gated potassium channel
MLSFRDKISSYLDNIDHTIGRNFNLLILSLIVISSLYFIVETYPVSPLIKETIDIVDTGILVIFLLEYILRLWSAESKLTYLFSVFVYSKKRDS